MSDDDRQQDVVVAALSGAIEKTHELMRRERERGMRRVLRVMGWEPRTIDLVVQREQQFIHDGIDDEA